MIKEILNNFCQNKNSQMLISTFIYICGIISVLQNKLCFIIIFINILILILLIKNFIKIKYAIIWLIIFYLGIINTNFRIKDFDELYNLAPINAKITGQILSIPQKKMENKQTFFYKILNIEYDDKIKTLDNEKILISVESDNKFNIYDFYQFEGRLSAPFKAGNPSQFDYGNYLRNYNSYAVFYPKTSKKIEHKKILLQNFRQKIDDYREKILLKHQKYLKSPNLEILGGIVFGDDAVSPPEYIKQSFINSGLLHILAASGMNVAFIFSFFYFIFSKFKLNYRLNISICMFMIFVYSLMTGLGPSIVRATFMIMFVLIGKLIDREAHSISLLSFVALIMLLYNPLLINDVGFQLSFVVTFGLLLTTPYLIKSKNKIFDYLVGVVCIPFIAQIWVVPLQIFYFNNLALYSIFANIVSVPILAIISFCGFVTSLLTFIIPNYILKLLDYALNPFITLLINISEFCSSLPFSSIEVSHPSFFQVCLYYLFLILLTLNLNKEIREKYIKLIAYILISIILIFAVTNIKFPNKNLEIISFDVGNADSFLIKTPKNKYIMIDTGKSGYNGGKSQAEIILLKYLKDNGIKNLDFLIITHFDNDHCGGACDLINNLKINKIIVNSLNHKSNDAKKIYAVAKQKNVNIELIKNNQTMLEENELLIKNYLPTTSDKIDDNESSIITYLEYMSFSMLFTGDAGIKALNSIKTTLPRDITVLKVGHHGALGVINKELLDYLNVKYSLISVGQNKFGHPNFYTLKVLDNTHIIRTDINNSIKFVINDSLMKILNYDIKNKKYKLYK